jgi:endonuclease III
MLYWDGVTYFCPNLQPKELDMAHPSEILKQHGLDLMNQPRGFVTFSGHDATDQLLNDLDESPHAFVLACLMDKQIKAERAWRIPYQVMIDIGDFRVSSILAVGQEQLTRIFNSKNLHRFNNIMAEVFYRGVERIQDRYGGDAAMIWRNNPSSAGVVRRFLEFHGAGSKIATMAANILARDFKVPMSDYASIDISPDVHVKRVFPRLGFVRPQADSTEVIYAARELNPEYPGIFDLAVWEVGQKWCRPSNPLCENCYLNDSCPKIGIGTTALPIVR